MTSLGLLPYPHAGDKHPQNKGDRGRARGALDPTKGPLGQPHPQSRVQGQVEEGGGREALPGALEKLQKVEGCQVSLA